MKASYRKRGNRHHIRYRDQGNPEHKEFAETFDAGKISKKDVQAKIDHINYKIKFQGFNPWAERKKKKEEEKITIPLQMAIDKFIEANISSGNWLPKTIKNYRQRLAILTKDFGKGIALDDLSEDKLQRWLTGRDIAATTKASYAREFNVFFKWLFHHEYTPDKWKIGVTNLEQKEIRNTEKVKYLTYDQLKRIEKGYRWQVQQNKAAGYVQSDFDSGKHPDAWWFMFWQGLRKNELPKITAGDIDLGGERVRIHGKGNKIEWIYMVPPAQQIIKRRLKTGSKGESVFGINHSNRLYKNFRGASHLALGKEHPTGLHQLRHGAAVHYISLGKSVQFVSKLLRHETIEVTLRVYADVLPEKVDQAFADVTDSPAL